MISSAGFSGSAVVLIAGNANRMSALPVITVTHGEGRYEMTKRERVLTAFSHRTPDKTPKWIQNGAHLARLVKENTGSDNPTEYFDMDVQWGVRYGASENPGDFSRYPSYDGVNSVNEWGIKALQGSLTPMRDFQTVDDVYEYPFPDVEASYRYQHLSAEVEKIKEEGMPAVSGYECGSFEKLWALRGMDNFLVDLLEEPEFLTPLIEKVSDLKAEIAAGYAKAGVDIVFTGD